MMAIFRLIITTILLFLFLFNYTVKAQQATPDNVFHPDSIKRIVSFLASDQLMGRLTGSKEAEIAAKFISNEFQQAGISPIGGFEEYFSKFNFLNNQKQIDGINVVGALQGKSKKEELIIFCAHYDHIGTQTTNPYPGFPLTAEKDSQDTIYNGANDNASGTAAMIMLARHYGSLRNNERTIIFIAFSGEEFGLKGSYVFSSLVDPRAVKAVINIEMIGRGLSKKANPFITGGNFSNLDNILNKRLKNQRIDTSNREIYFKQDPFTDENLYTRSDNFPFAQRHIPAHTLMLTNPKDLYYHSVNDEIETLDYNNMSLIIKAIAISCSGLVGGTDTPTSIIRR